MKKVITNYIFDASEKTVTFTDFTSVNLPDLYLITNISKGVVIFDITNASNDGTILGNVLTLDYNTASMSDSDYLKIEYEYITPIDKTPPVDSYENVDIITHKTTGEKGVRVFTGADTEENTHTGSNEMLVVSKGHVCTHNSTSTPLGINGVFTGDWQDTLDYSEIIVSIGTDKASAVNGLQVLWSADGVTVNGNDLFSILDNSDKTFSFPCQRRYVKIIYTNGVIAQTTFYLSTLLKRFGSKGSSHNIKNNIVPDDDAILTKTVLTGEGDDGIFKNVKVSQSNKLQVVDQPYTYAISEGDLLLHYPLLKFGTRMAVAANTQSLIWEGNTALYTYMTTAQQLKISSSSAQDGVAGTGALTIKIFGLDADFNEIDEIITMNGVGVVTTTKSFIRIFRAFVFRHFSLSMNAFSLYLLLCNLYNNGGRF